MLQVEDQEWLFVECYRLRIRNGCLLNVTGRGSGMAVCRMLQVEDQEWLFVGCYR